MQLNLIINHQPVKLDVSPKRRLLDVLREDLGLTGTKEGCGKGECGACTVILNGKRVNACLIPALQLDGAHILTIEGLVALPFYPALERAFIENGAVQCGFCIPGIVVSTAVFLQETPAPHTLENIKQGLSGNICRCTGYDKILAAVRALDERPDFWRDLQVLQGGERVR